MRIWLLLLCLSVAAGAAAGGVVGAEDRIDLDIRTLTSIDWEEGDELPEEIQELDGRLVVLKGYMRADQAHGLSEFLLVAAECACAGRPQVQHFVQVTLEDEEIDYRSSPVEIEGRLGVGVQRDEDGFIESLYRLPGRLY